MYKITVPATTANLGPGYDVLGMALSLYSVFECELSDEIVIELDGLEKEKLTIENNLVINCMNKLFEKIGKYPSGYHIKITNGVPLARGMGSSATAIIGGLLSANALMDFPLSKDSILELATEIEGHPDNVAPALLGNLIVSTKIDSGEIVYKSIAPFDDLMCVLFIPDYEISTSSSRSVVPKSFEIKDVVHNMSNLTLMIMGFMTGDTNIISKTMNDVIHEPYRKSLILGFDELKKSALDSGAFGFALSGAGSTVIAFCDKADAERVSESLQETRNMLGIAGKVKKIEPCRNGSTCEKID
ncbi:homoserine kinase [Peptostreptococcus sp. D1]|uniref:homoserine kinase n=1 Tax=Peptostreptococcus sp. D1 TaxID=72304 RepID=UPI0008F08803|nr:homoserine kinase [Peptostreptococcus sp. D1]SFE58501.1 homoserine kinase [Peptostreptococcus sp. D1]